MNCNLKTNRSLTNCLTVTILAFLVVVGPIEDFLFPDSEVHADETAPTLAVVNGTDITESDLEFLYLSRDVRQELRPVVRDRYIEELIDRNLLKEFLRSRKISAPKSIVDERVARAEKLITQEGLPFDETLKTLGYTRVTFQEEVALPLAWLEHARLVITDKSIAEYWDRHRAEFDGSEVRAAHIVKRLPGDAKSPDASAAKQELAVIRESILTGKATFSDAAREHSDSPSGKDGGNLGQFAYRGRMPHDLTKVAFQLKPGDVSQPFETPFGVHILAVIEIVPGDLSLEDARREIFHELSTKLQAGLITELRGKANITRPEQSDKPISSSDAENK
ncbi:MAG: peptidylprolyl isomerase [Planctomycetota bacterium]|nr:peptidylprolyl isomerase [Planctomycetota bacterium]